MTVLQTNNVTEEVVQQRSEAQHSSDWYEAFSLKRTVGN